MADKNKTGQPGGKKKSGFGLVVFMALFGAAAPFCVPTLLVCLGLLPSLVAMATDPDDERSSTAAVGLMNLAGVLPFVIELWRHGQTMEAAMRIIQDPVSWVIMFGAAGIGQLLLFIIPPFVTSLTMGRLDSRLETLRAALGQLETIWGPNVGTNMPIESVRKQNGA